MDQVSDEGVIFNYLSFLIYVRVNNLITPVYRMTMAHFFGTEGKIEQSCYIIRSIANKTSSHDSQLFIFRPAPRLNRVGSDEMTHES